MPIALTVSLTSLPKIKAFWWGIFDVQFVDGVDRGSLGNTRLLSHAKVLIAPIYF